ncbi:hypothetical protein KC316_g16073 [Hortaea werneckii]|nr:hypothetical protein KC324_g15945 [Hortaea werneckii]KAI7536672.1 hypothetical protein KC316_g16073 [Hortaea werneckii]
MDGKVVLQETAKLPTSVVLYIALSYCWGGKDPAKTLRSNFQVRVKGISIAALPRTYRETIYLARQLGINHIWIDALCIVQDDNEDWQRESSRMAEIYSGAYIVFVAAAASNVEGGLDPSVNFHEWRHLTEHQVKAGSMWVRYKSHNLGVCDLLPISTRAWAYQERQLANRCLMFGESEVAWECMQGCRCQCCAAQTVVPRQQPHLLPSVLPGTTGRRFASSQEAYEFWSSAVYKFSDMQLTRPTDRLPAISAIASVIQAETGDQYLAGFWRRGLLIQLTWRPYDLGSMDPPYDVYVAPSWSWASLPSNVSIPVAGQPEEACAEAAEILHVHCEPVNICSPLSAVHQGILTLRGLCVWVNVSRWPSAAPHDKLSIISDKFDFDVMLALDNCLQAGDPIQDPSPKRPSETHAMQRTTVEKHEEPDPPVKLLYLTGDDFLMLLPSRHESDKHVRVGQFSLSLDLVNRDEANKINVRQQLFRAASWELVVVI